MQKQIMMLVLSVFLIPGSAFSQFRPSPDGIKLERTIQLVKGLYVDDVDTEKLTEAAIRGMLAEPGPPFLLSERRGSEGHE